MVTQTNKIWFRRGMTLVETLVAITILLIALIGTSTFRYNAALDGRKADAQTTAARIALMFCESWKGISPKALVLPIRLILPIWEVT